jgi:hypothetical protein
MNPRQSRHAAPPEQRSRGSVPQQRRARPWAVRLIAAGTAVATMTGVALAIHGWKSQGVSLASDEVPLIGSTVSSKAQLARNTAEFGHMPIIHVYYPGLPKANAWTTGLPAANHSAVVVSFNASPSAILSGTDDGILSHFFDTAPRDYPIYYSYIHEPEHAVTHGGLNLTEYKEAWQHIVTLADRARNPQLHSTLILEAYDLRPGAHRNWKDYLPGGGIISTLGWDAYPGGGSHKPPSYFMAPAVAASKSVGLPFGFAEFGSPTAQGRAAWLTEVGDYVMKSGAVFATLFDSASVHPSFLVTDSASISAWRPFVRASAADLHIVPPSHSPVHHTISRPAGPSVTALTLSPSTATVASRGRIRVSFRLSQAANVTVCVLGRGGKVLSKKARPGARAGRVRISYRAGLPGQAGTYTILVVASSSRGSAVAERMLTLRG